MANLTQLLTRLIEALEENIYSDASKAAAFNWAFKHLEVAEAAKILACSKATYRENVLYHVVQLAKVLHAERRPGRWSLVAGTRRRTEGR